MDDDPRNRLAYDRTLLANERTGLGIAALGVALGHLPDAPGRVERAAAAALVAAGAAVVVYGGWRFARVGGKLREEASPGARASTAPILLLTLVVALILATVLFTF